jgi:starch-binding outer membrane protein, SusD/RagB family
MRKYFIVIVAIVLTLFSCKKNLEKYPVDTLTPTQAFATEQNLQLYVNSFYQMVPSAQAVYGESGVIQGYYLHGNVLSDLTVWDQKNTYLHGGFTSKDAQGWSWGDLRNINYFLEHYNEADVSLEKKNHYAGIARFFRAWFYYDKVNMFGDVPWYGKVLGSADPDLYKGRDPRTLVMDSVLADINFAVANISSVKSSSASTISKWTALALKSRICLYEGTYRKYHTELNLVNNASTWLENAANAAKELMNSGQYTIYSTNSPAKDYRALFTSQTPIANEVILARIYNDASKVYHNATGFFSNYGKYQPSFVKRFINTYLKIDGSRFTDVPGYDTIQFQNEVLNRDARLAQTIRTPGYKRSDGTVAPPYLAAAAVSGYQILKFSLDDPKLDLSGISYNSIPVIRYAEVLLNYAEAKAELGTFTNDDWTQTIAVLRKRAGITDLSMPTTLDPYMQANFYSDVTSIPLMETRRERDIELAAEGFRYTDLKRWKQGKLLEKEKDGIYVPQEGQLLDLNSDGKPDVAFVTTTPSNPVAGVYYFKINNGIAKLSQGTKGRLIYQLNLTPTYPDYKYYAPLPYTELLLNKNLTQNTGWDHP